MKKFAVLLLACVMAFNTVTVRAAEAGTVTDAGFLQDISGLAEFMNSVDLQSLNLDSFDIRKLNIDDLVQKVRSNEFLKNLDVSKLNLEAAVGLLQDAEVLGMLGLETVNKEEILNTLKDETIIKQVQEWAASASKGESISESLKAFVKGEAIQESVRKITEGKELNALLENLDPKNLNPLFQKGAAALFSEKQNTEGTELTEEQKQDSEIAEAAGKLLDGGLKALFGE